MRRVVTYVSWLTDFVSGDIRTGSKVRTILIPNTN